MSDLIKLLRDLFLINLATRLWRQMKPPAAFAWQTLLLLSLFSWLMSLLAPTTFVKEALSSMGWLFLTLGVGWALSGKRFFIPFLNITLYPGPWISGALTCVFLRQGWGIPSSTAYILWPTISAIIASCSKFLKPGPILVIPDRAGRQQIVLWLLSNAIASSWFGFHFLVQDWLRQFPSLLNEKYTFSAFVVRADVRSNESSRSRGVPILETAGSLLTRELEARPWSEVERWLLNLEPGIAAIEAQVKAGLADAKENDMWRLEGQVVPGLPQYTVVLQAIWGGPSAFTGGYSLQRSCLVTRSNRISATVTTPITAGAEVQCGAISQPYANNPPSTQAN